MYSREATGALSVSRDRVQRFLGRADCIHHSVVCPRTLRFLRCFAAPPAGTVAKCAVVFLMAARELAQRIMRAQAHENVDRCLRDEEAGAALRALVNYRFTNGARVFR